MQKRYHTLENIIFDAIVYLVMAFVLICCLVPFIYMLAVSFSGTKPLINGEVFLWPKDFTLDSYKQIFTYPNFFKAYGNTFIRGGRHGHRAHHDEPDGISAFQDVFVGQ